MGDEGQMKKSVSGQTVLLYVLFIILYISCIWTTVHALKASPEREESAAIVHAVDADATFWLASYAEDGVS